MSEKDYTIFTPWFGSWPPMARAEMTIMGQNKTKGLWGKVFTKPNLILAGITIGGGLLVWRATGFWHDIGVALVIAGILGLTIDNYLKRELATEAVKAALGYVLPDPLKEEMRWVVGLKFLAIEHTLKYDIRINEGTNTVCLHSDLTRRLWNFTEANQEITPKLSIDEMGVNGRPSEIEEFCYRLEDQNWFYVDVSKPNVNADTIEIKSRGKVSVPAKGWIEIKSKYHITKQINDVEFMVLPNATKKPIMNVILDDRLEYRKGFTHRDSKNEQDVLQGTLLPNQSIYVRWWPKGKGDG